MVIVCIECGKILELDYDIRKGLVVDCGICESEQICLGTDKNISKWSTIERN